MPFSTNEPRAAFKNAIFWSSLFIMFGFFISLFFNDFKPTQKEITLKIDIKDKVNICLPETQESLNQDQKL